MKILLIEDDKALAMGTEYSLTEEGMQVYHCVDFADAKQTFLTQKGEFSCVLLDIMLPDATGYEICQWLKARNKNLPIIFLTALSDEGNIVQGLNIGGDDYLTKPFRIKELIARIHANTRKYGTIKNNAPMQFDNIHIDHNNFCVWKNDEKISLTPSEFKLLEELLQHQGQIITREQLMERLWSIDELFVDDNTLSVYIRRLREKIDDNGVESYIKTVRGVGYAWRG